MVESLTTKKNSKKILKQLNDLIKEEGVLFLTNVLAGTLSAPTKKKPYFSVTVGVNKELFKDQVGLSGMIKSKIKKTVLQCF